MSSPASTFFCKKCWRNVPNYELSREYHRKGFCIGEHLGDTSQSAADRITWTLILVFLAASICYAVIQITLYLASK